MTGKTILVVDDEMHVTHILDFKLRQTGVEVFTASDGEEALAIAQEHRPDIVVTDFDMPVLNGLDMSIRLHERPETADIPVILLTARGHRMPEQKLAQANIRFIITKPFSARELIEKLNQLMRSDAPQAAVPPR